MLYLMVIYMDNGLYLKDLVAFLDDFLDVDSVEDKYCLNGLQVSSSKNKKIARIGLSVDANLDSLRIAKDKHCDFLIVHHGLFWGNGVSKILNNDYERLKTIFEGQISLYNCHIPLDVNSEFGNNIELVKILGSNVEKYFKSGLGFVVELNQDLSFEQISDIFANYFNISKNQFLNLKFGSDKIKRVFVCSGSGAGEYTRYLSENSVFDSDMKIDLLITGEISYSNYDVLKENSTNGLMLGHYLSETIGILALKKKIEEYFDKYNLQIEYIDAFKAV